ncbi:MAG: antibiotic biosynthesis monooxygenase [Bacteroidales bacterium]|nr:antibiotic biosynthesis monooxygenase [Bacteroidales bacterium]
MMKKTIVARVEVSAGKEEAFKAAAQGVINGTRKEAGNISYNLYECVGTPTKFIFYEEYADDDAFQFHANSDHFNTFAKAIKDLLAKDMIIESF